MKVPQRVIDRVAAHVAVEGDCIVSLYSRGSHGYTQVGWVDDGVRKMTLCHRVVWVARHGEIPDGLVVDHTCRNRRCINVDHLQLLPLEVNASQGGFLNRKSECIRGHPLPPVDSDERKPCLVCRRIRHHQRKASIVG